VEARRAGFRSDGVLGRVLWHLDVGIQICHTLFSHAGFTHTLNGMSVVELNSRFHDMLNYVTEQKLEDVSLSKKRSQDPHFKQEEKAVKSVYWTRVYNKLKHGEDPKACQEASEVLTSMNAKFMVIGHNPISKRQILTKCDGQLYMIDVTMSRWIRYPQEVRREVIPSWLVITNGDRFTPMLGQLVPFSGQDGRKGKRGGGRRQNRRRKNQVGPGELQKPCKKCRLSNSGYMGDDEKMGCEQVCSQQALDGSGGMQQPDDEMSMMMNRVAVD